MTDKQKGSLVVVSGFSGVGKGTVMHSLIDRYDCYALSVSATTRQPREGEVHGREYFFISEERFREMILEEDLIEYACYCDHYYGTPRSFVETALDEGKDVILEIEIQGARKIRDQYPQAVLIFIMPPDIDELLRRLTGRGSETKELILQRLERARAEAAGIEDYDYVFINDEVDPCADRIHQLITSLKSRTLLNEGMIETIRRQLLEYDESKISENHFN